MAVLSGSFDIDSNANVIGMRYLGEQMELRCKMEEDEERKKKSEIINRNGKTFFLILKTLIETEIK